MALMDWNSWTPRERAVLTVVQSPDHQILLIRKLRGLGAGKVTPPGGRIEAGESEVQAAHRELWEETGVRVETLTESGKLRFQFIDGYSLDTTVFTTISAVASVRPCDEADPFWTPRDQIPWNQLWADDLIWLAPVLDGRTVTGNFLFDADRMLESRVRVSPPVGSHSKVDISR